MQFTHGDAIQQFPYYFHIFKLHNERTLNFYFLDVRRCVIFKNFKTLNKLVCAIVMQSKDFCSVRLFFHISKTQQKTFS